MRSLLVVAAFAVAASSCRSGFGAMMFETKYLSSGERAAAAPNCGAIRQVAIKDTRPDPGLVGDRARDDLPQPYPLRMVGDSGAWAQTVIETMARSAGYAVGDAPQYPTLQVTLRNIELHERVFSNADYTSRVVIEGAVLLPNGQTCFANTFEGDARNYGRAASDENYQQTINHALEKAVVSMLDNTGIRDGLCSRCSAPSSTPPPVPTSGTVGATPL